MAGRVLIYGGKGALGSVVVNFFKSKNFWIVNVDLANNDSADANVLVDRDGDFVGQETQVLEKVKEALNENKLDAVICVAGGWAGGNAAKDLAKNTDLMIKQSVWSSVISASVASHFLREGGVLTLTGAKPAIGPTSGMIGYGMAKAAVHQLTKSLAATGSGLPDNSLVVSILPITLDTPMNRKWMPNADFSTWTPLEYVAELFYTWTQNPTDRPVNGSLIQLVTKESKTELVNAE